VFTVIDLSKPSLIHLYTIVWPTADIKLSEIHRKFWLSALDNDKVWASVWILAYFTALQDTGQPKLDP